MVLGNLTQASLGFVYKASSNAPILYTSASLRAAVLERTAKGLVNHVFADTKLRVIPLPGTLEGHVEHIFLHAMLCCDLLRNLHGIRLPCFVRQLHHDP